jgi:hypothetical protein
MGGHSEIPELVLATTTPGSNVPEVVVANLLTSTRILDTASLTTSVGNIVTCVYEKSFLH